MLHATTTKMTVVRVRGCSKGRGGAGRARPQSEVPPPNDWDTWDKKSVIICWLYVKNCTCDRPNFSVHRIAPPPPSETHALQVRGAPAWRSSIELMFTRALTAAPARSVCSTQIT